MPNYTLGIDPSLADCGYCVMSYDGSKITPVLYGCCNLNTDKGETAFFEVLSFCRDRAKDGEFSGIFYEHATFDFGSQAKIEAKKRGLNDEETEKLGCNIRRGQKGSVGTILGMAAVFGLKGYGGGKVQKMAQIAVSTNKKSLADNGHATKDQMIEACLRRFGIVANEHTCDAIGIALAGVKRIYDSRTILPGLPTNVTKKRKAKKTAIAVLRGER
jgi:Holliday junction resolvasome RuvABC endonuclease subunit